MTGRAEFLTKIKEIQKEYPECYIGILRIVILGYIIGDWVQMKLK